MNELALFAGAGGGCLASKLLGHTIVGYVEWEAYPQAVLKARIADGCLDAAPIFGDIRRFVSEGYAASYQGMVDVVSGGFPCQDISVMGKGRGIEHGERSGLWRTMADVISVVRPRFLFVENSPAIVNRGLGIVLGDLARLGFDCCWGVFSAAELGFEHERERFFLYAESHENHDPRSRKPCRVRQYQHLSKRVHRKSIQEWRARLSDLAALDVVERCDSYTEGRRAFYGLPRGMDRLKSLGNAQVPAVAALAFRTLQERLTMTEQAKQPSTLPSFPTASAAGVAG